jgi:hypothetical protein
MGRVANASVAPSEGTAADVLRGSLVGSTAVIGRVAWAASVVIVAAPENTHKLELRRVVGADIRRRTRR